MIKHKTLLGWLAALFISVGPADLPAQTNGEPETRTGVTAPAQSDQAAPDDQGQNGEVVTMSAFEVTTTQGHGYVSTNAAAAFKTDESLMNIPQGDIVITNDLIQDLNYENTTDVLQYFGASAQFEGESSSLRGSGDAYEFPYVDDLPQFAYFQDDVVIDSFEVIKGPAQVLYLNAPLPGVVLKNTKKPLPYDQAIVTASIDQNGLYRLTADFTGPLGKIGDVQIGYRLVGLYQHGNEYFSNITDDRDLIFPEFQAKYHNTTARVYFNLQTIHTMENGQGTVTPDGNLYTGAGRKDMGAPPGNDIEWEDKTVYLEVQQKISSNWENKLSAGWWQDSSWGAQNFPEVINWVTGLETFGDNLANERWHYWSVLDDWQGSFHLNLGGYQIENRDAFGFAFNSQTDKQAYWNTGRYPYPNGPVGGSITIPFNSQAALNAIPSAPSSTFFAPATGTGAGYLYETQLSAIYWQHTLDVIPNWLTLIAGFTWDNYASQVITDWSVVPWQATATSLSQWVHRFGVVLHLTKAVSLYALDSTTFTPPTSAVVLSNRQLPPSQLGTGTEVGLKWNFLGGKISGEAAVFKTVLTNGLNLDAGSFPNAGLYAAVIGDFTEEGTDGDAAFSILPGLQLIGSWYAGHEVDPYGQPVTYSYDNLLSAFMRYDFDHNGLLRGLSFGGGLARIGSRWIATTGEITAVPLPARIKLATGSMVNAFISYSLNKHWLFRVNCGNVLNQAYIIASQGPLFNNASPPRTFSFLTSYKF